MSETEEKYVKSDVPQSLIEALLLPNRSIIIWHDPEKEKPSTHGVYLAVTSNGRWHKAYFEGDRWWDIGHSSLPSVVLFGTFDLPELPEVKA